jgi:hypothetical protein
LVLANPDEGVEFIAPACGHKHFDKAIEISGAHPALMSAAATAQPLRQARAAAFSKDAAAIGNRLIFAK